MKLAVVQLDCMLADVRINMEKVINYIKQASKCGADLVLLPEFFPSAIGFAPQMNSVALEGKIIRKTILRLSKEQCIIIGGSNLYFDGTECHNTFDLVFPDGSVYTHRKDIPTQFENCYAKLLHTPVVHANHCGKVTSYNYPKNNRLQTRQLIGAAQVINSEGKVIERKEYHEGEGLIITEITQGIRLRPMAYIDREKYWIPDMP